MGDINRYGVQPIIGHGPARKGLVLSLMAGACVLYGGLIASPALAAEPVTLPVAADVTIEGDENLTAALKGFVEAHDYDKALALLTSHPDVLARQDGFRLEIKLLLATRQDDKALVLLEQHLSANPNDGVARFQVAEIHFRHGRDRQATLDYRLALAGDLAGPQSGIAHDRLSTIVRRKSWRFWMGASLAPDSTINGTTDDTRTALYGLPFNVYVDGAHKSGISFNGYLGAEKLIALSPGLAVRSTALVTESDGPGRLYDSRTLSVQSGPEWTFDGLSHVSVAARGISQWLGGKLAQSGGGVALHGDTYGNNLLWAGQVSADRLNIRYNNIGPAWNYRFEVKRTRYLGTSSLWSLDTIVARRGASFISESYYEGQVKVGRLFQAPLSTFVFLEATQRQRLYDGHSATFPVRRIDAFSQLSARFSKRDLHVFGAMPYVAVLAARNKSNVALYKYNRVRFDFGFTRDF